MAIDSQKLHQKRQLVSRRLSLLFGFKNKAQATRKRGRPKKRTLLTVFPAALSVPRVNFKLKLAARKTKRTYPKKKRRPANRLRLTVWPAPLELPLKPQTAATLALIVVGLAGAVYFGLQALGISILPRDQALAGPPAPPIVSNQPKGLAEAAPTALRIPAIGVSSPSLVELGREADGTLSTPKQYELPGWYKYAPTPGEIGPAIIVGHVDNYRGPAIFYRLKELKFGDVIEVDRADGKSVKFTVYDVKTFYQSNFPTAEVYGNINYAGLRVITCGGQFNQLTHQYDQNVVAFASIVE